MVLAIDIRGLQISFGLGREHAGQNAVLVDRETTNRRRGQTAVEAGNLEE